MCLGVIFGGFKTLRPFPGSSLYFLFVDPDESSQLLLHHHACRPVVTMLPAMIVLHSLPSGGWGEEALSSLSCLSHCDISQQLRSNSDREVVAHVPRAETSSEAASWMSTKLKVQSPGCTLLRARIPDAFWMNTRADAGSEPCPTGRGDSHRLPWSVFS